MLTYFRALRRRPFALLWLGQTVSRVGDFLYEMALALWVRDTTGSALAAGTVLLVSILPTIVFMLIGGVVVDRYDRIKVMLVTDVARMLIALSVAIQAATGDINLPWIYAASLAMGVVDGFFGPAYFAAVPQLTPAEDLTSANALGSLSVQLGRITGPPLGAWLFAVSGPIGAFGGNAASFLVSAAFLLPLLRVSGRRLQAVDAAAAADPEPQAPESATPRWRKALAQLGSDLRLGVDFVRGRPWIVTGMVALLVYSVGLVGPFAVGLPFLARDHLHISDRALGLLLALFPIGYVLGGLVMGSRTRIRRRGPLAYGGLIAAAFLLAAFGLPTEVWDNLASLPILSPISAVLRLAFGLSPTVIYLGFCALVNGFGLEVFGQIWVQTLQEVVPEDIMGRVSSIESVGSYASIPLGFVLTGWAIDRWSAPPVFIIGGLLTAGVGLLALSRPVVWEMD